MVAVAFLLIWGGYSAGLWGWCLIRDYNLTLPQLVSPTRPYSGPWPPATIPASQTWPSGQAASSFGGGDFGGGGTTAVVPNPNATGDFPVIEPGGQIKPGTGTGFT
jgi:hypothetical protein